MAKTDPSEAVANAAEQAAGERAAGEAAAPTAAPESPTESTDKDAGGTVAPSEAADAPVVAPDDEDDDDVYRVSVEGFEGPLDLLLHLIRKHELDILNIPISFITKKYLEYLDMMKELQIDVASEYLVMAAQLAFIKSKTLLPPEPNEDGDEDGEGEELDPRGELVKRLLEYQKYRGAAHSLRHRATQAMDTFSRGSHEPVPEGPAPLAALNMFRLFEAFDKVIKHTEESNDHQVLFEKMSITERVVEVTELLHKRRRLRFEQLFFGDDAGARKPTRAQVILTFLALLEMCKMRLARVIQHDSLGALAVELASKPLGPDDAPLEEMDEALDLPDVHEDADASAGLFYMDEDDIEGVDELATLQAQGISAATKAASSAKSETDSAVAADAGAADEADAGSAVEADDDLGEEDAAAAVEQADIAEDAGDAAAIDSTLQPAAGSEEDVSWAVARDMAFSKVTFRSASRAQLRRHIDRRTLKVPFVMAAPSLELDATMAVSVAEVPSVPASEPAPSPAPRAEEKAKPAEPSVSTGPSFEVEAMVAMAPPLVRGSRDPIPASMVAKMVQRAAFRAAAGARLRKSRAELKDAKPIPSPEVIAVAPEVIAVAPEVIVATPEVIAVAPEVIAATPEVVDSAREAGPFRVAASTRLRRGLEERRGGPDAASPELISFVAQPPFGDASAGDAVATPGVFDIRAGESSPNDRDES